MMNIKFIVLVLFLSCFASYISVANTVPDQILGKWMSTEGNVTVQVFKEGDQFKAKVVWFDDSDDKTKPMKTRTDEQNPDRSLRNRKIIGLEILRNMKYNASTNQWEKGIIYDTTTGKEWSSLVSLTKKGLLLVKGFAKHFQFLSKTTTFKKVG